MDTSGRIRALEEDEQPKSNEILLKEEQVKRLKRQSPKARKNWMRNKPCPCKSGKKFKKCCWGKMARLGQAAS